MMKALKKMSKRGMSLQQAPTLIMLLVVIGIVGAIGLSIITQVGASFDANSSANNATDNAEEAVSDFFSLLPVLGTVFIAVILLAAVGALAVWGYTRNR